MSPQAITTEGKYWKSRIEIVIREYHKWRTYFKKRVPGLGQEEHVQEGPIEEGRTEVLYSDPGPGRCGSAAAPTAPGVLAQPKGWPCPGPVTCALTFSRCEPGLFIPQTLVGNLACAQRGPGDGREQDPSQAPEGTAFLPFSLQLQQHKDEDLSSLAQVSAQGAGRTLRGTVL